MSFVAVVKNAKDKKVIHCYSAKHARNTEPIMMKCVSAISMAKVHFRSCAGGVGVEDWFLCYSVS